MAMCVAATLVLIGATAAAAQSDDDPDFRAIKRVSLSSLYVVPYKTQLAVGDVQRVALWVCPFEVVNPGAAFFFDISAFGTDRRPGTGDDGCERPRRPQLSSQDGSVASVRRRGKGPRGEFMLRAVGPGETDLEASAVATFGSEKGEPVSGSGHVRVLEAPTPEKPASKKPAVDTGPTGPGAQDLRAYGVPEEAELGPGQYAVLTLWQCPNTKSAGRLGANGIADGLDDGCFKDSLVGVRIDAEAALTEVGRVSGSVVVKADDVWQYGDSESWFAGVGLDGQVGSAFTSQFLVPALPLVDLWDVDGDGSVTSGDAGDALITGAAGGTATLQLMPEDHGPGPTLLRADLDGDGDIDVDDLAAAAATLEDSATGQ